MTRPRLPAVSGVWYPNDPAELAGAVRSMLVGASTAHTARRPAALIAPHAGFEFSGPVAASAYRLLEADPPERAVLLGPSHFVSFDGVAVPSHTAWQTPLGALPIDEELRAIAAAEDAVVRHDAAHRREHSLEVQLPFLQELGVGAMLPMVTGDGDPAAVARVLGRLLDEPGVVAVISSDLSHYLAYDAACAKDRRTAAAITDLRPDALAWDDACGRRAVQALLHVARARDWSCRLLDLRNSGDTAGGRSRVVGYGAFALGPAGSDAGASAEPHR